MLKKPKLHVINIVYSIYTLQQCLSWCQGNWWRKKAVTFAWDGLSERREFLVLLTKYRINISGHEASHRNLQ